MVQGFFLFVAFEKDEAPTVTGAHTLLRGFFGSVWGTNDREGYPHQGRK